MATTGESGTGQVKPEIVCSDFNESFDTDSVKNESCEIDSFPKCKTNCNSSRSETDFVCLKNATVGCQKQTDENLYVKIENPEDFRNFEFSQNSSTNKYNTVQMKSDIDICYDDIKKETFEEQPSEDLRFCEVCYESFGRETDSLNTTSCRFVRRCPEPNESPFYMCSEAMTPDEKPSSLGLTTDSGLHSLVKLDEMISEDEDIKQHLFAESCRLSVPSMENISKITMAKKKFHCKFCSKSFSSMGYLKIHERSHTGEKPFNCKICSKLFRHRSSLVVHEKRHTGDEPFHCKICSKSFSGPDTLKVHQRSHTGEKPFHCKMCSKSFSQSGHLKDHEWTHTGEKPFHCKVCSKSFSQMRYFKIHENNHTGEKFHCKICFKPFLQMRYLKVHEKRHTSPRE